MTKTIYRGFRNGKMYVVEIWESTLLLQIFHQGPPTGDWILDLAVHLERAVD